MRRARNPTTGDRRATTGDRRATTGDRRALVATAARAKGKKGAPVKEPGPKRPPKKARKK